MKKELINYPYVSGKYGIPFEQVINLSRAGMNNDTVITGSGNELRYFLTSDSIDIADPEKNYWLSAWVERDGIAKFNLKSRNGEGRITHPDMFAGKFVDFSFEYFKENGIDIIACRDYWHPNSDNWKTFWQEYEEHKNKIMAAKNTWGGKTLSRNGFTEIFDENIIIRQDPKYPVVEALFKKPHNNLL